MEYFFKYMLPMIPIITSTVMVVALVSNQKSQRAERKPEAETSIQVGRVEIGALSLNFTVNSKVPSDHGPRPYWFPGSPVGLGTGAELLQPPKETKREGHWHII